MAEWKKEIRILALDYGFTRAEILNIFRRVEELYAKRKMPLYYKGNRNEFLYDKAQREIMNRVYA